MLYLLSTGISLPYEHSTQFFISDNLSARALTVLAVVDPQMHPPEELHAILGLFDGEINLYEKETEKGSEKFLKIKRMSNQEYLEDELLLKKGDLQRKG